MGVKLSILIGQVLRPHKPRRPNLDCGSFVLQSPVVQSTHALCETNTSPALYISPPKAPTTRRCKTTYQAPSTLSSEIHESTLPSNHGYLPRIPFPRSLVWGLGLPRHRSRRATAAFSKCIHLAPSVKRTRSPRSDKTAMGDVEAADQADLHR